MSSIRVFALVVLFAGAVSACHHHDAEHPRHEESTGDEMREKAHEAKHDVDEKVDEAKDDADEKVDEAKD
ncbi:MAG TPA: hypothetical protein VHM19_15615 [Polyangiales bacterium]|jgi:hypothetical protein|nr:hypothetical protein [Polyangiales bacterium]